MTLAPYFQERTSEKVFCVQELVPHQTQRSFVLFFSTPLLFDFRPLVSNFRYYCATQPATKATEKNALHFLKNHPNSFLVSTIVEKMYLICLSLCIIMMDRAGKNALSSFVCA